MIDRRIFPVRYFEFINGDEQQASSVIEIDYGWSQFLRSSGKYMLMATLPNHRAIIFTDTRGEFGLPERVARMIVDADKNGWKIVDLKAASNNKSTRQPVMSRKGKK